MPYVGVTFDQQLGFRHTFDIPNQAAAVADTFNFAQGQTWWGVQAGLDILDRGGVKAGRPERLLPRQLGHQHPGRQPVPQDSVLRRTRRRGKGQRHPRPVEAMAGRARPISSPA
jgi:hypothetical protein